MAKYWEDYEIGEKYSSPGRTLTEALVTMYVSLLQMDDPWFLDEEEAKKSVFGTLVAPGSMTLAFADKLGFPFDKETQIALVGLEGRFKQGGHVGDTIRAESEIIDKKPTKDPGRGILFVKTVISNQLGVELTEAKIINMVKRKEQ